MNSEQKQILALAISEDNNVITTVADSPNDLLWRELEASGHLEAVDQDDLPEEFVAMNFRCYRATEKGRQDFELVSVN